MTRFQATFIDSNLDSIYTYFHPKHPTHPTQIKQTQNTPKTDPKQQPNTQATTAEDKAFTSLLNDIINTVDEKGKIKPKSYFINTKKRAELKKWDYALNDLKTKELIKFKNGVGYFLTVDISVALNSITD